MLLQTLSWLYDMDPRGRQIFMIIAYLSVAVILLVVCAKRIIKRFKTKNKVEDEKIKTIKARSEEVDF